MKGLIRGLLFISILFLSHALVSAQEKEPVGAVEEELEGTVTLSGAWAIYPTAVAWGNAFQALHPRVKVDVSAGGAGKGASDAIAGLVDIGMVSRDPDPAEIKKGIVPIYILHDAVFPVVSEKNPALGGLLKKGVKKQTLIELYIKGIIESWDVVVGNKVGKPVHVYTRSDSCGAAASWAKYLGNKKQEDLKGVGIYGDPGVIEAAKKDPVGIGYGNFSFVFTREGKVLKGIKLIPIDSNENGIADPDEIYESREAAIKAIRSGRYPATRKNYFFVKGKPQGIVKEFIKFALSDEGAKIVDEAGTSLPVLKAEREKLLKSLE
ncbi:MAG: phosphate ABC transporter substrate-binding protein [Candidatus Brocadia sp.]|nr:phosphate ABC transporter substrate-binding protein [Candidatus Brocadia sp.]